MRSKDRSPATLDITDVGLHTGGKCRDTCLSLVLATVEFVATSLLQCAELPFQLRMIDLRISILQDILRVGDRTI